VKKFERVKVELEIALRDIKQKEAQLQADKASKESRLKRTEEDITQLRNEIIKLKRQMNMLGH
jgi:predicted  nucleic acid-binding Zn-ribbon protein